MNPSNPKFSAECFGLNGWPVAKRRFFDNVSSSVSDETILNELREELQKIGVLRPQLFLDVEWAYVGEDGFPLPSTGTGAFPGVILYCPFSEGHDWKQLSSVCFFAGQFSRWIHNLRAISGTLTKLREAAQMGTSLVLSPYLGYSILDVSELRGQRVKIRVPEPVPNDRDEVQDYFKWLFGKGPQHEEEEEVYPAPWGPGRYPGATGHPFGQAAGYRRPFDPYVNISFSGRATSYSPFDPPPSQPKPPTPPPPKPTPPKMPPPNLEDEKPPAITSCNQAAAILAYAAGFGEPEVAKILGDATEELKYSRLAKQRSHPDVPTGSPAAFRRVMHAVGYLGKKGR